MRYQQTQAFCHRCQQPRLHTRNIYTVPHGVHLGIVICCLLVAYLFRLEFFFLAVLWLPVWALHSVLNIFPNDVYRCAQCGQKLGERLPVETPMQAIVLSDEPPVMPRAANKLGARLRAVGLLAGRLPSNFDRAIVECLGRENVLLHWFVRVVVLAGLAITAAVVAISLVQKL